MKLAPQLNLVVAWVGIFLGFASGMMLGLFFHREEWLGGYTSFRRRLYRLAHISFFGLGAVNFAFFFTVKSVPGAGALQGVASLAFIIGAISMPICCILMAHFPKTRALFGVPVLSLLLGGVITCLLVLHPHQPVSERQNFVTTVQP